MDVMITQNRDFPYSKLIPHVQHVIPAAGFFNFHAGGSWSCDGSAICCERISELFAAYQRLWDFKLEPARVCFEICETLPEQSYQLSITRDAVVVRGGDDAALFYGALTLFQLVDLSGGRVPCSRINDAPAFAARGVMLDISRDKVPSMRTLFALINKLAQLKINHLQLYMEHTFAYQEHARVWRDASALTAEEVRALDRYCVSRFIQLVPNQNSFGHMERWLALPEYNHLAALPEGGAPLPWGGVKPYPTALNPIDPRSIEFLDNLYAELLPCFTAGLFNVGCDEVFELGLGRCAAATEKHGAGRVYLEFLKKVFGLVAKYKRRPVFWGDIILKYPELIAELPSNAIALEWGYEADHPFAENARLFHDSGLDFYVCPGTSSWNSVAGRFDNMRENIRGAARNGLKFGAKGLVVTDWGDGGHWQPLCVSYPGFVYSAAASWNPDSVETIGVVDAVARFFISASALELAEILVKLGDLYKIAGALCSNSSVLFHLLFKKDYIIPEGVTIDSLDDAQNELNSLSEKLRKVAVESGGEPKVVFQELSQIIRLLSAAILRGKARLAGSEQTPAFKSSWKVRKDACAREQEKVWMLRNRRGGIADSLVKLY